jgi:predicted DNA-binding protein
MKKDRTAEWAKSITVAARLPAEVVESIDALASKLSVSEKYRFQEWSRNAAIRLALLRGIEMLESEINN